MKVLLMTSFAGIGFNNAPSIGLYRLQQFINEVGVDCDIVDFGIGGYDEALAKAKNGEYQVIGMSVSHYHMKEDLRVIWELKAATKGQKCVFVAGGQEATFNYKNWLIGGIDVVFLGFGEKAIAKFCNKLKQDFDGTMKDLTDIKGIAYRRDKDFVYQQSEELTPEEFRYLNYDRILDLKIPFDPYWNQIREDTDDLNFWTSKFVSENVRLYTTSHCPYKCAFCSSAGFLNFSQQKQTRLLILSAEDVFSLIMRYIERDNAKGFLFSDDEFLLHKDRVGKLCDLIIEAKKSGRMAPEVMFSCQNRVYDFLVRTDQGVLVEEALIEKMVAAGFHSIGLGVETFVDRLLVSPSMNKKGFVEKDTLLVLDTLIAKGLTPQINQIVFIPEATKEEVYYSIRRSLEYIRKGCQVAVTPLMHATAGAPVTDKSGYAVRMDSFTNPETGEKVMIKKNFIPHDKEIADCCLNVWKYFDEEVRMAKEEEGFHTIPKTLVAILMFTSVVKLLKDAPMIKECEDIKRELIDKSRQLV